MADVATTPVTVAATTTSRASRGWIIFGYTVLGILVVGVIVAIILIVIFLQPSESSSTTSGSTTSELLDTAMKNVTFKPHRKKGKCGCGRTVIVE